MHGGGSVAWTATISLPPHPSVSGNKQPAPGANPTQTNKYTLHKPSLLNWGDIVFTQILQVWGIFFNDREGTQCECAHIPITASRD